MISTGHYVPKRSVRLMILLYLFFIFDIICSTWWLSSRNDLNSKCLPFSDFLLYIFLHLPWWVYLLFFSPHLFLPIFIGSRGGETPWSAWSLNSCLSLHKRSSSESSIAVSYYWWHIFLIFLYNQLTLLLWPTADSEFWRSFFSCYPWRWDFSRSKEPHTEKTPGPWWRILQGDLICFFNRCDIKSLFSLHMDMVVNLETILIL